MPGRGRSLISDLLDILSRFIWDVILFRRAELDNDVLLGSWPLPVASPSLTGTYHAQRGGFLPSIAWEQVLTTR